MAWSFKQITKYIWNEKEKRKESTYIHTRQTQKRRCRTRLMSFKHGQQIKQVATDEYNGLRTARHRHDYCYIEGNTSNYRPANPIRAYPRNIAQLQHVYSTRACMCASLI